jgi:hypothetical protein
MALGDFPKKNCGKDRNNPIADKCDFSCEGNIIRPRNLK